MTTKKCVTAGCENPVVQGRRYCRECYLSRKREMAKKHYYSEPKETRGTRYNVTCLACGKTFLGWRKGQKFCSSCYKDSKNTGHHRIVYEVAGGGGYCFMHRKIAERVLDRRLNTNEVVHHINLVETDNSLKNLMVLSRQKHAALHEFLRQQRVMLEKSGKENFENCWKDLIAPMTNAWLETANVKVEKLWEISQSAAEPPNNLQGEGSETMHEAPEMGEDIVQTTTANAGLGDKK